MIERGKIKPWQPLWMVDPFGGGGPNVIGVEYIKHWGSCVRVRRWVSEIVEFKTRKPETRRVPYLQLVAPQILFKSRAEAEACAEGGATW